MGPLYKAWETPGTLFGDLAVLGFVTVQCLDGVFTYMGVHIWGPGIEVNPLISSAMAAVGPGTGLAVAKIAAIGFGMALHLKRVHGLVAILTAFYLAVSILPWTALFFMKP